MKNVEGVLRFMGEFMESIGIDVVNVFGDKLTVILKEASSNPKDFFTRDGKQVMDYMKDIINNPEYHNVIAPSIYSEGFKNGKEKGYEEGREEGYEEGYELGYEEAYSIGREEGYDQGREEGYKEGYESGYEEGCKTEKTVFYDDGVTYEDSSVWYNGEPIAYILRHNKEDGQPLEPPMFWTWKRVLCKELIYVDEDVCSKWSVNEKDGCLLSQAEFYNLKIRSNK